MPRFYPAHHPKERILHPHQDSPRQSTRRDEVDVDPSSIDSGQSGQVLNHDSLSRRVEKIEEKVGHNAVEWLIRSVEPEVGLDEFHADLSLSQPGGAILGEANHYPAFLYYRNRSVGLVGEKTL